MNSMLDYGGFTLTLAFMHLVLGTTPTLAGLFGGAILLIIVGGIYHLYKRYKHE